MRRLSPSTLTISPPVLSMTLAAISATASKTIRKCRIPSRAVRRVKSAVSVNTTARFRNSLGKVLPSSSGRLSAWVARRRRRKAIKRRVRGPRARNIPITPLRGLSRLELDLDHAVGGGAAALHDGRVAPQAEVPLRPRDGLAHEVEGPRRQKHPLLDVRDQQLARGRLDLERGLGGAG